MSDYKNDRPLTGAPRDPAQRPVREGYESTLRNGQGRATPPETRDVGGWEAYRRWLNKVQSGDKRRSPMDPALYTWKGYRNWSEKIRRDWKPDEQ